MKDIDSQKLIDQYLNDELSFSTLVEHFASAQRICDLLVDHKRSKAYRAFVKASKDVQNIQSLFNQIINMNDDYIIHKLNWFLYHKDLLEYTFNNNIVSAQQLIEFLKQSNVLYMLVESDAIIKFILDRKLFDDSDFECLFDQLSTKTECIAFLRNQRLMKLMLDKNILNKQSIQLFVNKLQNLKIVEEFLKSNLLHSYLDKFFNDEQFLKAFVDKLLYESIHDQHSEGFHSLKYAAIRHFLDPRSKGSKKILSKAIDNSFIDEQYLDKLIDAVQHDEIALCFLFRNSLIVSQLMKSEKLEKKLFSSIRTPQALESFFADARDLLYDYFVEKNALIDASQLKSFNIGFKDFNDGLVQDAFAYRQSKYFKSLENSLFYGLSAKQVKKEQALHEKILCNLEILDRGLFNFNFNTQQILKVYEICKANECASMQLKTIVDSHLESEFNFELLIQHLSKPVRKNLLNV